MNIESVIKAFNYVFYTVQPLLIGIILALSIDCLVCWFEKKIFTKTPPKVTRTISVASAVTCIVGVVVGIVWISVPDVAKSLSRLIESMPAYLDRALQYLDEAADLMGIKIPSSQSMLDDWTGLSNTIVESMSTIMITLYDLFIGTTRMILGFVFSIYVLLDKTRIKKMMRRVLDAVAGKKTGDRIYGYIELCAVTFKSFMTGQIVEALILGALCFVGMIVIGLPYASIISVLIGITSIIPVLGSYIGLIPSALLLLLENPVQALVFIIFIVALQQFESAVIYPKVVGNAIGIDGLLIFVGVTLGAGLGGVLGLIIGVPLVAVLYAVLTKILKNKEKQKRGSLPVLEKDTKE